MLQRFNLILYSLREETFIQKESQKKGKLGWSLFVWQ